MKSAIPVILEKDTLLSAVSPREGSRKADPDDRPPRHTDAALERIVRRSKATPARPKTSGVAAVPATDDDLEPVSALFRAAAARVPVSAGKLPARFSWWLAILAVAAATFAGGLFLGRNVSKAPTGLLLEAADARRTLVIRWNYKAVQNLDHATLYIDDGGRFITLPLNHSRLVSGYFPYPRKFSLVTVTMVAGDLQAVTSFAEHSPLRQVGHREPLNH